MKLIINEFRAAGRLANEWRDTLFYSALGVMAVKAGINNHVQGSLGDLNFVSFYAGTREMIRALSWLSSTQTKQIAGFSHKSPNVYLNACIAAFVMSSFYFTRTNLLTHDPSIFFRISSVPIFAMTILTFKNSFGGNFRDIPKYYFDKDIGMWDWPRRNGSGGGPTQTQKLIDGFKQMRRDLAGLVPRPRPSYRAAPAHKQSFAKN